MKEKESEEQYEIRLCLYFTVVHTTQRAKESHCFSLNTQTKDYTHIYTASDKTMNRTFSIHMY